MFIPDARDCAIVVSEPKPSVPPRCRSNTRSERPNTFAWSSVSMAAEPLAAIDKWYSEQLNQFLLDLKNTPEGDGTSMLDNTLLFYFSEIYDGPSHSNENVPVTLHGGSALRLKGGRHLKYGGRSTNDIWAAIAQAFGVPMEKFGPANLGQGAVGDLSAIGHFCLQRSPRCVRPLKRSS